MEQSAFQEGLQSGLLNQRRLLNFIKLNKTIVYRIFVTVFCVVFCLQVVNAQSSQQLLSPDGKIEFSFSLSNDGAPVYSISYQQKAVILSSSLGLNGWERGSVLSDVSVSKQDTFGNLCMANEARFVIITRE
jgi:hypothetical protein